MNKLKNQDNNIKILKMIIRDCCECKYYLLMPSQEICRYYQEELNSTKPCKHATNE